MKIPIESDASHVYKRKIGDTEIIVENHYPQFRNKEEQNKAKSNIMQLLYDVFSKYDDKS